ncbi:MAG: polyphosphate kinase 1 [Thiohalophilus sp.]|uniref:polyphosphate kinase 1 n=1 Tax=Thiohalophilus sp. TaxID=3028392 RepID=UPI00287085C8|nr:polyphosphate kinase 1 [Thiohalophilus sp.]MDR9435329.1 polyphosphate kinase 1 [Thiohalophilus sp.]
MEKNDLTDPDLYFNRELSLLQFQWRVLAQASDESVPLLERLRFLCISSTNLDEFFEIRVAGLMHRAALESTSGSADSLTPEQLLARISDEAHRLVDEQYRVLNEVLIPELAKQRIHFLKRSRWNQKQAAWIKRYFSNELLPVLSPLGLDPAHPFPRVLNRSLNFIVALEGKDAFGRDSRIAIVQAPRSLPRLIRLPSSLANGETFVFLSSIIHTHVSELFPGMNVTGCYQFRVTRDSDLFVDEEEIDDLMRAIKGELSSRRLSDAVRLEVADNCSDEMAEYLLQKFKLDQEDLFQVNGPVNLNRLLEIHDLVDRPELKYPPFTPGIPKRLKNNDDLFEVIRHGDVLLHHPFESFAPIISLLKQAAGDPKVLAIKQTLYRTGADSPLVDALVEAARGGKEVTVVVELRARFDEAANIELATRLQDAGAHVVYGVVGHKTHAKLLLIVRREGRRIRRYAHLGTGNYHAGTARVYTDYGLLTCDNAIGEDVHRLFTQLTGLGKATKLRKLLQSPFTLHKRLLTMIDHEAENARNGQPARIIVKVNSLVESKIIAKLYEASQAGVKIDLIVRGICCLRPGVAGISDNIQVRSIVGRFLEHTRIYYFENGGDPQVYCSSADWMDRNFFRRVETCFPIEDPAMKKRVINDGLLAYLTDNTLAWQLQSDGTYRKVKQGNQKPRNVQRQLLEKLAADPGTEKSN